MPDAGWAGCVGRCVESMALVTPKIVVGTRDRLITQTHPFDLGTRTRTQGSAADNVGTTAFEVGVAVNAVDDGPNPLRHAVACIEIRRSGLAPCCRHVRAEDPALGLSPFGLPYHRSYQPPPALWEVPFSDPAHGVRVIAGPGTGWGANRTYADYLDSCPQPMAADDEIVSDMVFFILSERIEESEVAAIPLALSYPDGTDDPAWFESLPIPRGDVVGYGYGEPGTTSLGLREGIRRVALAATALTRRPAFADPGDPTSRDPLVWRFTADGSAFPVFGELDADGLDEGGGASHVDLAAPWLFGTGPSRRLYAVNWRAYASSELSYTTHLTPEMGPVLRAFFDPDGDGRLRGSVSPGGADYVDADGDGLAEYRVVDRADPGAAGCIDAVPPVAGRCWLSTSDDNCPPPPGETDVAPYANRSQLDRDGDGIGDACDVCRDVWDPEQTTCVAYGDHGDVVDGQIIGAACAYGRFAGRDADGDGVNVWCDNCPTAPNPLQEDLNGNGVGDACEADSDYDGIVDPSDNCPFTHNPSQEVCNEDVPQLHPSNGLPMGVACLPTPCALVDPVTSSTTDPRGFASEIRNDLIEGAGFVTHLEVVRHRLRPGTPDACAFDRHVQTGEGAGLVTTGMRWCPCPSGRGNSTLARLRCEVTFGCTRAAVAYDVPSLPSARTWREMTVDFSTPALAADGDEVVIPYAPAAQPFLAGVRASRGCTADDLLVLDPGFVTRAASLRGQWDFIGDATDEHAEWIAELTACDPACPGVCVLGVCEPSIPRPLPFLGDRTTPFSSETLVPSVGWAHARRYERCDASPCRNADDPDSDPLGSLGAGSDQASHYWSGETVVRTFSSGREPDIVPFIPHFIPFPEICWFCADAFPDLWLAHEPCGPAGCTPRWVARAADADVPVNDQLTLGAHVALTQLDLAWVYPRELKEQLAPEATLMVGVDAQARVIAQLALTDAGTVGLLEEKGDPLPPPQNPNLIAPPDIAFPQRVSDGCQMRGARPANGALFLIANQHTLIGLGGEGHGIDHITFTDLRAGTAHSIAIRGDAPGRVLASAMHVTRMEALVLDEHVERAPQGRGVRGRGAVFVRFLRVDLRSGDARELARVPRLGVFDRHELVGMADGRYALIATHGISDRTWVFALGASGERLHLSGIRRMRGHPLGRALASRRGLSLPFIRAHEATWAPRSIREIDFVHARVADLGAAM